MKILVCISSTSDTTTKVKFDSEGKKLQEEGVQWIINPWDELTLTRAIELKKKYSDVISMVSVAIVGEEKVEPTLRKALALGADEAVRIDAMPKDSFFVSRQLTLIAKDFDLILAGVEGSDFQGGGVGQMLAEMIDIASVSGVSFLDIKQTDVEVKREIQGGKETLKVSTPVVIVGQKGIAHVPAIASIRGVMDARRKEIRVVPACSADEKIMYDSYELPEPRKECKMFDENQIDDLFNALRHEAKVLQ
ncbi:MAG: hypothetical protein ACEPOW_00540 [Bacteroidales bacterium]